MDECGMLVALQHSFDSPSFAGCDDPCSAALGTDGAEEQTNRQSPCSRAEPRVVAAVSDIGAPQLELQVEEKSFPREVFDGSCTIVTASSSSLQRYKVPKSVTF